MRKFYPLGDYHPAQAFKPLKSIDMEGDKSIKAIYSGEKRKPKKGEWYLSGSDIKAYQAPNDLGMVFHIAKIVRIKTITTIVIEEELPNK